MAGRLPVKIEAYQNQCFNGDEYTGFQCPENDPNCPLKKGDGYETDEALGIIGQNLELDHDDGARFSATRSTLAEQVTVRCADCHSRRHENDASASRFRWR